MVCNRLLLHIFALILQAEITIKTTLLILKLVL